MKKIEKINLSKLIHDLKKNKFTNFSLHKPKFDSEETLFLKQAIDEKWVSTKGPKVNLFEKKLRFFTKSKYCIATNTGTAGLYISLKSMGIKKNDEVLIPNLTFIASVNSILYCDAIPNIVDTNENDLNISIKKLEIYLKKIVKFKKGIPFNKRTKNRIFAMMPVHVFGHICEMNELKKIGKKYNIKILEDSAEALGSMYKNNNISQNSEATVISFNGNKIITCGAGGAILTNSKKIAEKAMNLVTLNNIPNSLHQNHFNLGYNLRMPAINANLGLAQLKKLHQQIKFKRHLYKKYKTFFSKKENIFFDLYSENKNQKSNYWLQVLILKRKYKNDLNYILKIFKKNKISIRTMWTPLSKIYYLRKYPKSNLKNSITNYKRVICIPSN